MYSFEYPFYDIVDFQIVLPQYDYYNITSTLF